MGQGGYLNLVNSTKSDWKKIHQHSYQMNSWNFPDTIKSGSTVQIYIEWDQQIGKHQRDDKGEARYSFGSNGNEFEVQARNDGNFNLQVKFINLESPGIPSGSTTSLGWNHNGYVSFVIAGAPGNFSTTNMINPSWMQSNLGFLGNKLLKDICITGSHDSGMSEKNGGTFFAAECNTLTQSLSIEEQLAAGARYFDIRPVISAGKYYTGHYGYIGQIKSWQGANGQKIEVIVNEVNAFTKNNKELVVLNLSHDLNTDVGNASYRSFTQSEWDNLFLELNKLNHLFVVANDPNVDLTKMSLNKFIANQAAVIIVLESNASLGSYEGNGFFYYANFNVYNSYANTNDFTKMAKDQLDKMKNNNSKYFLLSWTLTQDALQASTCFLGTASSIKELADEANQRLQGNLYPALTNKNFPNIIYSDNILGSADAVMAMAVNYKVLWNL